MAFRRIPSVMVMILTAGILAGCSSIFGDDEDEVIPVENRSAREIFDAAQVQLDDGEPINAAKGFDEIERLFPFSQLAKRAIIMSAYSYYQGSDFPAARASAKRYLDLYPSDTDAPYAQYLIALTYYDNIVDIGRDQAMTKNALQELTELTRRYPDSEFARDAGLKIDLTNNHIAGKEMEIGRYYLKRGHFTAAINRFRVVLEKYQTTAHTPEALHRLVEAYLSLGLEREAQVTAAVLGHNFVGEEWYAASYALLEGRDLRPASEEDAWYDSIYRQVFEGGWL